MNSPSPLVPQGAIPPKTMSRSARVLVVGFTVVAVHVVGLSIFLLQGCKKDLTTAEGGGETNAPASAMSFPTLDTNAYYTNVAALPTAAPATGAVMTATPTNPTTPALGGATSTVATAYPSTPTAPTPGITADAGFPTIANTTETTAPAAAWTGTEYKIAKGDTLSGIASRNSVTISAIQQANPGLDPRKLKIGQTIKVPAAAPKATTTAAAAGSTGSSGTTASGGGTYKVKAGDTLTRIAAKHGVTVNELRAANNMRTTRLLVGQTLNIPQRAARTAAASATNTAQ